MFSSVRTKIVFPGPGLDSDLCWWWLSRLEQGAGHPDTGVTQRDPHHHRVLVRALLATVMSRISHKRFTSTQRLTDKIHERLGVFYFPATELWSLSWEGLPTSLSVCRRRSRVSQKLMRTELSSVGPQPGMIWSLASRLWPTLSARVWIWITKLWEM